MSEDKRLRLKDIAVLAGLSKSKVRADVKRGELTVVRVKCGTTWRAEVEPAEAKRYLAQLLAA